jgi:hypothetical protein
MKQRGRPQRSAPLPQHGAPHINAVRAHPRVRPPCIHGGAAIRITPHPNATHGLPCIAMRATTAGRPYGMAYPCRRASMGATTADRLYCIGPRCFANTETYIPPDVMVIVCSLRSLA